MEALSYYIHCFGKLRRDNKNGGAPHKPVLLLSIIELYSKGVIKDNRVYITPEIVSSFKSIWSRLVVSNHHMIFALPFYHLRSEPFWSLIPNAGSEKWVEAKSSMRSFANLSAAIDHAKIDAPLFQLLQQPETREILRMTLLDSYFPHANRTVEYDSFDDLSDYQNQMLEEDPGEYRTRILKLKEIVDRNTFEEEVFVRSGIFKREISKIYNNTCAISELRIDATINVSMIDACHIVPFSESYDDTVTNGLALSPTLHRAFDRGLISISNDYKVLVSKNFREPKTTPYSIKQFKGKSVAIPSNSKYAPSLNNLIRHRDKFGFS